MFTVNHFIWCAISLVLSVLALVLLLRRRVPLQSLLTAACVLAAVSEVVKVLNAVRMVPAADGSGVLPYLPLQYLPLHLCSVQILLIFYMRFARPGAARTAVLAFMYPSCLLGALLAIAMPSLFINGITPDQAFTHPLAYQFFLYHVLLVVLGLYILLSGEVQLRPRHYLSTVGMLYGLGILSLYFNSMFANVEYENGVLTSVEYVPNYMSTYIPPLPIPLNTAAHWQLYILVILLLAAGLIALSYLPVFLKARRRARAR